ncbi:MAG TPA: RNA-binding protein [Hyphomicrobiaceae bacterium]|nr:RNA-binding protein [Hyphomicrobiaceae bacterium]
MGARAKEAGCEEADGGSLRLCALSRVSRPPEDLVRFVAGPDGTITPDLARRLPGRGVWIDATRQAVAAAVRQKAFARSLKRQVSVAPDLADLVERLMARRLLDALSLANKAGLVVTGFTKVEEMIGRGGAAVLLHAADAAADGTEKLDRKFKALAGKGDGSAAAVRELTGAEMSLAMGRPNVIHAAAAEGGATRRLIEEARRLRRYRLGDQPGGDVPPQVNRTQDVHD